MTGRRFFILGARPVKFVPTPDGGLDVRAFDWQSGEFVRDMSCLSRCSGPDASVECDEVDEARFLAEVRRLRAEGPARASAVEIEEGTTELLDGVTVGAANFWTRTVSVEGAAVEALTAMLSWDIGGVARREFVGEGSVVPVGPRTWRVTEIEKPDGRPGRLRLSPA